jgi:hypothetical protein
MHALWFLRHPKQKTIGLIRNANQIPRQHLLGQWLYYQGSYILNKRRPFFLFILRQTSMPLLHGHGLQAEKAP